MPMTYIYPQGDRRVEFWQQYRNGEHAAVVCVPSSWDDADVRSELEEWVANWGHQYDYRYGWNSEGEFGRRGESPRSAGAAKCGGNAAKGAEEDQ